MPSSSRGTWMAAVFVALVLGFVASYLARGMWQSGRGLQLKAGEGTSGAGVLDTVGVLPVENAADDADGWVRWGLSTVIAETLQRTPGLSVVDPDRLAKVLGERGLGAPGSDRERLRELTTALGADVVLDPTFRRDQLGIQLAVEFIAADGRVVASRTYEAATALSAAEPLVQEIGSAMVPGFEPMSIRRALSGDSFYDRLYATGVQTLLASYEVAPEENSLPAESVSAKAPEVADEDTGALEKAMGYFAMAVQGKPDFLQARLRWVDGLRRQRRLPEARRVTEQLLQRAQAEGAFEVLERLFREMGRLEALQGNLASAEVQLREAHRLSLARGDSVARAANLGEMARLALASGNRSHTEELLVEVLGIREQAGDRLGRIDVLLRLGSLLMTDGDLEGARSLLDQAQILAQDLRDPWTENRAAASLGEVASRQGNSSQAVEFWSQALRFYRSRGDDARCLVLSRRLAETLLVQMQWKESEAHFLDVLELAEAQDDPGMVAHASVHLAWLQLKLGYAFQAEDHLQRALSHDRYLTSRDRLQRVIAWFAYEQNNRRLALETQEEILRQCLDKGCWTLTDQAFLDVFRLALAEDRRLPVPGETGGPDFPGW